MSAEKPYLLLDVDGVLNAFPPPKPKSGHVHVEVDGWPIWYQPTIIERITELSERVEVMWLTTWRERAAEHLAPAVGLPEFGVVPHDIRAPERQRGLATWWKLDAAEDLLADNDRRAVWCDDDLDKHIRKVVFGRYGDRVMTVTPMTSPGLTHKDLDRIQTFLGDPS